MFTYDQHMKIKSYISAFVESLLRQTNLSNLRGRLRLSLGQLRSPPNIFDNTDGWDRIVRLVVLFILAIGLLVVIILWGDDAVESVLEWAELYPASVTLLSALIITIVTLAYVILTRTMALTMRQQLEFQQKIQLMVKSKWQVDIPMVRDRSGKPTPDEDKAAKKAMVVETRIYNYSNFPVWIQRVELFVEPREWNGKHPPVAEKWYGQAFQLAPHGGAHRIPAFKVRANDFLPSISELPPEYLLGGWIRVRYDRHRISDPTKWIKETWVLADEAGVVRI